MNRAPALTSLRRLAPSRLPLLAAALLSWGPAARAQSAQVEVDCAGWSADDAAAFEARSRAELSVRALSGRLALSCGADVVLYFQPDAGGEPGEIRRTGAHPSVDDILELLDSMLPTRSTPAAGAGSTPEPRPNESATNSPSSPSASSPSASSPSASSPSASSPSASSPPASSPSASSPPASSSERSRARSPISEQDSAAAATSGTRPFGAHTLALAASGGLWGKSATAGLNATATLELLDRWALGLDAHGALTLDAPSGYAVQAADIVLGLRYALAPRWSIGAASGLGVTRVYTQNPELVVTELGAGCSAEGRGAHCFMLAGKVDGTWCPGAGALRPRLTIELAWAGRSIEITEDANSQLLFSLPWIRPSVLIGVEWRDRTTRVSNKRSSSE